MFGEHERTVRSWLNGLEPDHLGSGKRGDPNKFLLARVSMWVHGTDQQQELLDLEQQRARQAKETADKLSLENEVTRGELVPAEVAVAESERYVRQLIAFLDSLPARFVRLLPHFGANDHSRIRRVLINERNKFAADLAQRYGGSAGGAVADDRDAAGSAA